MPNERRSRASSASTIEHSSITISPALRGRPVGVEGEGGRAFRALGGPVNERVDGCRACAAPRSHHQGGFAGEGGERRFASRPLSDVSRKRRLAHARVAKKPEHLGFALFEPAGRPGRWRPPVRATIRGRLAAEMGPRLRGMAAAWLSILGGAQLFPLSAHPLWLGARAAAGANRRLAAEIIIFRAAGQALALGSEPTRRRRLLGQ